MITRHIIAVKINDYFTHKISREELIDWAENALMEAVYEEEYFEQINAAVTKIGSANVKNFELFLEDYESILNSLGYSIHVEILKVS